MHLNYHPLFVSIITRYALKLSPMCVSIRHVDYSVLHSILVLLSQLMSLCCYDRSTEIWRCSHGAKLCSWLNLRYVSILSVMMTSLLKLVLYIMLFMYTFYTKIYCIYLCILPKVCHLAKKWNGRLLFREYYTPSGK